MNFFEEQIHELGKILHIPLHAEKGHLCKLRIHGSLSVQLEYESSQERILFASFLCELPPGKFREDVLKEALKSNHFIDSFGTFAYSENNNNLVLFSYLPGSSDPSKIADSLMQFIEKAEQWKTAINSGQINLISQKTSSSFPSPFKF